MRESKEVLGRFKVSLKDANDIKLTKIAFESRGVKKVLENISKIQYSEEELARTKDILWDIQDKISNDAKVIEYLKTTGDSVPNIKNNIEKIINKLINRQKDVSNGAASKNSIEKSYDNVLTGIRMIAEVLRDECDVSDVEGIDDKLEKEMIQGSLKMIADKSNSCMTGCKDVVETLLACFGDRITKRFEGLGEIDDEQNKLKKELKEIFYEARLKVTRDIISEFLAKIGDIIGIEPHYKVLCTQVLNDIYGFNIPDMDVIDTLYTDEQKQQIKNIFLEFISSKNLELMVYNKACEIFYDEFFENKGLFKHLYIWADSYYKNNLIGQVEDLSSFMSEYVMIGEYDDIPRYVALEEVMRDMGFVEINSKKHELGQDEAFRAVHDAKSQEEINAVDTYGRTMLMYALNFGAYEIADEFINKGIDVNIRDDKGQSALLYAFSSGSRADIINKLLERSDISSDIYKKNRKGRNMLMCAIENGASEEMISMLIDKGVEIREKDYRGKSVLMYALERGLYEEIISRLLDIEEEVYWKDIEGKTVLMYALGGGASEEIINRLLDKGAEVRGEDFRGKTVLMYALEGGASEEIINRLLDKGAEVRGKDVEGKTVLMYAFNRGLSEEVINRILNGLLDNGSLGIEVEMNAKDRQMKTVLKYAVDNKAPITLVYKLLKYSDEIYEGLMEDLICGGYEVKEIGFLLKRKGVRENLFKTLSKRKIKLICNKNIDVLSSMINYYFNNDIIDDNDFIRNGRVRRTKLMYALDYDLTKDILEELIRRERIIRKENGRDVLEKDIVNEKTYHRDTLLIEAVGSCDADVVKMLIDKGAKVNEIGGIWERTALIYAAEVGKTEIVKILLDAGAKVDKKNRYGKTALMYAAEKGKTEIVKILLDAGAKVNKKDRDGKTVLMYAVDEGNVEIVKMLLDAGAKVNKVEGYTEEQRLLKNGFRLLDVAGMTLLMRAVWSGKVEIVKMLLDAGEKLNEVDRYGKTALMYASIIGKINMVKMLLDAGEKLNEVDRYGKTALMYASIEGNTDIVKILINKGAELNKKSKNGETALMYAAIKGNADIVKMLIDKGAELDKEDKNGATALMYAVSGGDNNIIKMLIDAGAKVNKVNKDGETALIKLVNNWINKGNILKELLVAGVGYEDDDCDGRRVLLRCNERKPVKNFVYREIESDVFFDRYGRTKLMNAIYWQMPRERIKELIREGKDINVKDVKGRTVLMYALANGCKENIINMLIRKGQDINESDVEGKTALMYAMDGGENSIVEKMLINCENVDLGELMIYVSKKGNLDMMKLLVDKGADINIQDKNGWTPIMHFVKSIEHIDVRKKYSEGIEWFLNSGALISKDDSNGKVVLDLIRESKISINRDVEHKLKDKLKEEIGAKAYMELQENIKAEQISQRELQANQNKTEQEQDKTEQEQDEMEQDEMEQDEMEQEQDQIVEPVKLDIIELSQKELKRDLLRLIQMIQTEIEKEKREDMQVDDKEVEKIRRIPYVGQNIQRNNRMARRGLQEIVWVDKGEIEVVLRMQQFQQWQQAVQGQAIQQMPQQQWQQVLVQQALEQHVALQLAQQQRLQQIGQRRERQEDIPHENVARRRRMNRDI